MREVAAAYNAENNNDASVITTVTARQYPDLRTSGVTVPPQASGGGELTVGWTVSNAGPVAASADGGWVDRIVLSADGTLGNADDVVLGEVARPGALAANSSYAASATFALPANLAGGSYRVFVVADATAKVVEPDTRTDNAAPSETFTITTLAPNLEADAVFGPADTVSGGETFIVSWRVRNTGQATAPGGHVDRIVLSADGIADASDLVLAELVRDAPLAVGSTYSVSVPVSVQDGRSGQFRLILVTDAGQQVFENLQEADNIGISTPVTFVSAPSPNLVVESVTVPDGAVPGQTVPVTFTVRNNGTRPATAPWTDRIYIDNDTTVSGGTLLASVTRNFDLAAGEAYTIVRDVTLPTSIGDSGYHVIVRADAQSQVFEGGAEADNDLASLELVLSHPDLLPSALAHEGGAVAESNSTFAVRWRITNTGTGTTPGPWTDTLWLSRDNVVGGGDIRLGDLIATGPLAPGETYDGLLNVTLPIDAQDAYRLILRTDSGNALAELSAGEANNQIATDLTVGLAPYADLVVSDVTAPALTIQDPARVTVGYTVTNTGTGRGVTDTWSIASWSRATISLVMAMISCSPASPALAGWTPEPATGRAKT